MKYIFLVTLLTNITIISPLSLDEKIGQLLCIKVPTGSGSAHIAQIEQAIDQCNIGGILLCGYGQAEHEATMIRQIQQHALLKNKPPLIVMQDLEWGLTQRLPEELKFPFALTLGAIEDDGLIYKLGKEIGHQALALGVNFIAAPVADINSNPDNPIIGKRSFGCNTINVTNKVLAFLKGLHDTGIISCAKHWPGHGDVSVDSHIGLPTIDKTITQLQKTELIPFQRLIDEGVDAVMVAHLISPALTSSTDKPTSLSRPAINFLKNTLHFNRLVIPDALDMGALTHNQTDEEITLAALVAGNDILLSPRAHTPVEIQRIIATIKQAIYDGVISEQEIDKHLAHIMAIKSKLSHATTTEQNFSQSSYAQDLKKQLFAAAVTVVPGKNQNIPLPPSSIAVVQVVGAPTSGIPPLKYFTKRIKELFDEAAQFSITPHPNQFLLNEQISFFDPVDTIIVGFFEISPSQKQAYNIDPGILQMLETLKQSGKKIIVCLFGSPYSLAAVQQFDSIIVGYEDDPDAHDAVAQILAGKLQSKGTLPINPK
jgi:beta-glucosidase-like glycosyl hydrolase